MNQLTALLTAFLMAGMAIALGAAPVHALPAEKPLQPAGPPPSDTPHPMRQSSSICQPSAAQSTDPSPRLRSDPTLVTANTFGGSI
jgi:hypothetical protein